MLQTAGETVDSVRQRRISAREVVESALESIDVRNAGLGAFIMLDADRALDQAGRTDASVLPSAETGTLHGLPIAVKDLQETAGMATTFGTVLFRDHLPDRDALAVERLRAAGAIVVGKTNTPAFGALGETKNRLGPDCRNPSDRRLTPGGSRGGSAAAVSAGMVALATGTDSAGSISCPASFCGIVGMKPSHGRVPQWPESSLLLTDTGSLAGCVSDVALALDAMAGPDDRDPISIRESPPEFSSAVALVDDRPLVARRVAVSADLGHFAVEPEVEAAVVGAARRVESLGAHVEEAAPPFEHPLELYMPLYLTDFRRFLAGLQDDPRDELFPETMEEFEEYRPLGAGEYVGLLNRLWHFRAAVERFFEDYQALITPATACTAFPLRKPPARIDGAASPGWRGFMPFQVPWNLSGAPSVTLPCAMSSAGRPIGMLVVGRPGDDVGVLRIAAAFERFAPPEQVVGDWRERAATAERVA